jgi:hypothetical protein
MRGLVGTALLPHEHSTGGVDRPTCGEGGAVLRGLRQISTVLQCQPEAPGRKSGEHQDLGGHHGGEHVRRRGVEGQGSAVPAFQLQGNGDGGSVTGRREAAAVLGPARVRGAVVEDDGKPAAQGVRGGSRISALIPAGKFDGGTFSAGPKAGTCPKAHRSIRPHQCHSGLHRPVGQAADRGRHHLCQGARQCGLRMAMDIEQGSRAGTTPGQMLCN